MTSVLGQSKDARINQITSSQWKTICRFATEKSKKKSFNHSVSSGQFLDSKFKMNFPSVEEL